MLSSAPVSRLGVVVVDGIEAKDFGLSAGASAVNSAGVAGMGEPRRLPRCSGIDSVVIGGARSTGGWGIARLLRMERPLMVYCGDHG